MGPDFQSRADVYAFTERRVVVDVPRFARYFLNMGNVFRECTPGIYDERTGDLLVNYVKGGYFLENGKKVYIHSWSDFEEARSDVFNHLGRCTITHKNLKRIPVSEKAPVNKLAIQAASAVFGKLLHQNFEYTQIGRNIVDLNDVVYMDSIENNDRRWQLLRNMEEEMIIDIDQYLRECKWKELLFHKKNDTYMIDVMLDIRLKDYYERLFDRLEREADERRESEYEGRPINCT